MEIEKGIEMIDLCLYLKKHKTLIISDPHFGFEEALNNKGILIPRTQWKETKKRIESLFAQVDVKRVILNGDIKHDFGSIRETEWRHILRMFKLLESEKRTVIIVQGNHDTFLNKVAIKHKLHLVPEFRLGNILILHGDKIPLLDSDIKLLIVGHEHPAITFRKGQRVETYKCFIKGIFQGKKIIGMPSFHTTTYGTDLLQGNMLSPFFLKNLDEFNIYVISDKIYSFGTLGLLRKKLCSK